MSKNLTPAQALHSNLEAMKPRFSEALPEHVPVKKFIGALKTAASNNPKLLEADRHSLYAACMKSAETGLMPDGVNAALVPFFNKKKNITEVQFMKMIAGDLRLARNSGEIKQINSQIIYKNDEFEYWADENGEHLKYKPNFFGERGEIIGAFAQAVTKDGGVYIEIMTMEQINAVKNVSRSKDYGPWSGPFYSEMVRKTVLKRILKRLPMSTDFEIKINKDDAYDSDFSEQEPEPQENEPQDTGEPENLKQLINENDEDMPL